MTTCFQVIDLACQRGTRPLFDGVSFALVAKFPQGCMRGDRMSAYMQWDMPYDQAMANEFRLGRVTLASGATREGAARFAAGKGRGGDFDDI